MVKNICSIKIGEDIMDWQNGGVFAFNDACEHEAWNDTNEFRYILVVDVLMNKIENQLNSVNIRMIFTQIYYLIVSKIDIKVHYTFIFFLLYYLFYLPILISLLNNNETYGLSDSLRGNNSTFLVLCLHLKYISTNGT